MIGYPKKSRGGYPDWEYGDVLKHDGNQLVMFVSWERGEPKVFLGIELLGRDGLIDPNNGRLAGMHLGSRYDWDRIER